MKTKTKATFVFCFDFVKYIFQSPMHQVIRWLMKWRHFMLV
uniref:Uncharacterized protein n=1 Tax=Physcomitrium patens TaxID=3218 RepID=A0A2K1IZJ5_PHYPA|nr:hypothetical protein PHYPA_022594 [Physcomitrium patens]